MATNKPDLTRVWASNADPADVIDPDDTTANKFIDGWQAEIPPFEHFNFIQNNFSAAIAHANEQGVMVWDISTTYPINGMAKGSDGIIYVSLLEQSGNDPISDIGTNWKAVIGDVRYFDTIALAKASTILVQGITVITRKYRAGGNGGGATYTTVASGTGTDDGGSYHDTSSSGVQLELVSNGVVTPLEFGAYGDNVNDDVTELNAMFAYAQTAGLNVDGLGMTYYTQAVSATYDGVISNLNLRAASVQEYLIRIIPTESITIINCDMDGDSVAAKLLYFLNDAGSTTPIVRVNNCILHDAHQSPSTGQSAFIQVEGRFNDVIINGNECLNSTSSKTPSLVRGFTFEKSGSTNQSPRIVKIINNSIVNVSANADADGVNFTLPSSGDTDEYSMIVTNNRFKNCEKRSVKSQIRHTVVSNNVFIYDGTPVDRFAEVEGQQGGLVCTDNKFYTDSSNTTGFRFIQVSDDDTLLDDNASIVSNNHIFSTSGDEFVVSVITDDTSTPTRTLKGIRVIGNIYIGTCQYFVQLNPVAHGAGATTTVIDNLEVASNQMFLVTGALFWHGRRSGPSSSSRVRLSAHDNMHGDASTVDVPLFFDNTTNLSRVYIKDADNENFLAGT